MASTEGGTSGSGQAESGSNSDTSKMDTVTLPVQLTSVSSSIQCLVRDLQQEERDADRFIAGHVPPNDVEDFLPYGSGLSKPLGLCTLPQEDTPPQSLPFQLGTGHQQQQQSKPPIKANTTCVTAPSSPSQQQDAVILQTAVATIGGATITQPARLMFDTGSSRSFITQEAQQALQLAAKGSDTIAMAGFGDSTRKVVCLPRVQLSVGCDDGSTVTVIANVVDNITCPIQRFPLDYTKYPVLQSVNLAEPTPLATESVVVDVLIGGDHYHHLIGPQVISVTADLVLVESKLGFIPSGKVPGDTPPDTIMHLSADSIADDTLPALEDLWSLESLGINDNPETTDNDMVREHFNATIRKENGRYTVNWPWKEKAPQVNYELARGRLVSLIKRLFTQPDILRHYDQTIRDQHASGIIEEVPNAVPTGPVHYLPHQCVQRQASTTTKLRIVYDASAKTNKDGNSLNDCLHSGPSLLPDLGGILVRFRLFPVGITSDIEKAFLQVGLDEPDRDYTRFLWLKDISQPVSPANLVTYRFCRIPFGVISSPFLLSATIHHHLGNSNSTLGSEIRDSTYVDNVITGRNTADEASTLYDSAKSLFNAAAMNLQEWSSKSDEFNHTLPDFDKATSNNVKCLGLAWDTKEDTLNVISPNVAHKHANTKRSIISAAARFYDPVGYLSPLFVRAKLLIQDIWKAKLDWDDPVPNSIADDWQAIAQDLDKADTFKLHRFTGLDPASVTRRELHVFCDASEKSYGTVAYLREESATAVATVLLVSKTKVAPLKQMTIPRLELMAAPIGARLIKFLQNTLPFDLHRTVLWSDSTCVLHWINGTNQQSVFVQRRLMEIRSNPTIAFKYVNTDCNPADLPSRGATAAALHDSKLWWEGPEWLRGDTSSLGELPSPSLATAAAIVSEPPTEVSVAINSCSGESPFISIERYSSWSKAVRVMAYVKLAIQKLQGKCKQQTQLTTTNIKEAEMECLGTPGMEGDFGNDPTFEPDTSLANTLLTAWTDGQRLLQTFWSEWQYSYLPTLRERGQTALPHGRLQAHDPPAVGTVVLVKEENMPRGSWLIGRIDKLHNSNDGEIRSATVVLPSKRQIQRPLCLLYPIVQAENHDAAHDDPPLAQPAQPVQPAQPTQQQPARPTRRAAAGSRANLKNLISLGAV
ncbi:uncharacterized protein LOC135827242 [Sycon ciliatum]|uniref:uncharacterized protein LOC135827242 n=1 Tax=Sycon ciliatum TaxID=27933 RepID=UPI0031F65DE5